MANVIFRILDSHRQWLPRGALGQLYVGGPGLAIGYLNERELTNERFVTHTDNNGTPTRLYNTGDLARWLPNGELQFLGRNDHQIKLRGYRIEPGEIEACLNRHETVNAALVVKCPVQGTEQLVAYIVPECGTGNEAAMKLQLLRHMEAHLPAYMVPDHLCFLDSLPLSASGKIERDRLPPVVADTIDLYCAPRNSTEQTLADIWADVLNCESVGIHDNFFALGGDSIYSIQMVARARRAGLTLTARELFEHQTIAELAPVCGQGAASSQPQAPVVGELEPLLAQYRFLQSDTADLNH